MVGKGGRAREGGWVVGREGGREGGGGREGEGGRKGRREGGRNDG